MNKLFVRSFLVGFFMFTVNLAFVSLGEFNATLLHAPEVLEGTWVCSWMFQVCGVANMICLLHAVIKWREVIEEDNKKNGKN